MVVSIFDGTVPAKNMFKILQASAKRNSRKHKNGCWNWPKRLKKGYGVFTFQHAETGDYVSTGAHRASLELKLGRRLKDWEVARHMCPGGGNKACCCPEHLEPGSQSDNMLDDSDYERNSEDLDRRIVMMRHASYTWREIGEELNITDSRARERFKLRSKHSGSMRIIQASGSEKRVKRRKTSTKELDEMIPRMSELAEQGWSSYQIAKELGISVGSVVARVQCDKKHRSSEEVQELYKEICSLREKGLLWKQIDEKLDFPLGGSNSLYQRVFYRTNPRGFGTQKHMQG